MAVEMVEEVELGVCSSCLQEPGEEVAGSPTQGQQCQYPLWTLATTLAF